MWEQIIRKIGDNRLYGAFKVTLAATLPFIFFYNEDSFVQAFTMATGALLTAPVDIESSLKHKVVGILSGSISIAFFTFLLASLIGIPWVFYPVFIFVVFLSSFIGVYGQRANMLAFTSLLAISLSFIHQNQTTGELLLTSLYLFLGGFTYLIVALIFYLIRPHRFVIIEIAKCMDITAEYLDLRSQLWSEKADRDKITELQLGLQIKLNELHESVREYLVHNKIQEGNTANNRKVLISLSSLIEIMELASAHIFDHAKIRELYKNRIDIIDDYQKLAHDLAVTLHSLSYHILANKKYHSPVRLTTDLRALKSKFELFQKEHKLQDTDDEIVIFSNVLFYVEKQIQKLKGIERVYKGRVNADDLRGRYKDIEKFLTPQHYRLSILKENFNFSSTHFRYALRMTLTMLSGYIFGQIFSVQNEYWILLTIVVIMRPGYGLTKQRTKQRILGTVIGGIIAFSILYFIKSTYALVAIAIVTMILGYWLSYAYYRIGVTFVTIYVVLIYGIMKPDVESLLLYRVIDTLIGAMFAFTASHLLWPSWEFLNIKSHLKKSILSIRNYIFEIKIYYNQKGEPTTAYKLARKQAFIEVGNLMASFQRMIQEPKSKQRNKVELYELAVLNQTLVSSCASMGTYIQSHHTSESSKAFDIVMERVMYHLDVSLSILDNQHKPLELKEAETDIEVSFTNLKKIRSEELEHEENYTLRRQKIEESRLIIDQLIWMINLSEKILKVSKKIKVDKTSLYRSRNFQWRFLKTNK